MKKPKLLYLPNTWEMLMNVEKDINNLEKSNNRKIVKLKRRNNNYGKSKRFDKLVWKRS
jgi:chromatin remodeling complex protein RSC6